MFRIVASLLLHAAAVVFSLQEAVGYAEFLKFASDFDLSSSVILSTLEIGDIFLSSIKVGRHTRILGICSFDVEWRSCCPWRFICAFTC